MVWQPRKGVSIKEVKSGLFLFHFFHKIDFNNILEGRPWFFDKHTLILGRIKVRETSREVPLIHVPFWV